MTLVSKLKYGFLAGLAGLVVACGGGESSSTKGCNLITNYGCGSGFKCVPDEEGEGVCVEEGRVEEDGKDSDSNEIVAENKKECYGPWLWRECEQGNLDSCSSWSESYNCPASTICREGICDEITWQCYNGPTLKLDQVCDGYKDCSLGDDEEGCNAQSISNCSDLQYCLEGLFGAPKHCAYSNDYSKDQNCWAKCWALTPMEVKEKWINVESCINLNCGGRFYSNECAKEKINECSDDLFICGFWCPLGEEHCPSYSSATDRECIPPGESCDGL